MDFTNAFTVDVEDYFQVSAFEQDVRREQWEDFEHRVVPNTRRVLALLGRHQVRATFFILGWVANRFAELVQEIHAAGHEIGSHGYWHRLIYDQSPQEFRQDMQLAGEAIFDAVGEKPTAYRAPSFSITKRSRWALDVLAEQGFKVDSSIFPTHHDRYGIPDAQPGIHHVDTPAGRIWEFPMSVVRMGPVNLPVSGGGYFRLYPFAWTRRCLASINKKQKRPFVFYIHPWELDPQQPRIKTGSRLSRTRHYLNLASTEAKLDRLLDEFRFAPISEVVAENADRTKKTT